MKLKHSSMQMGLFFICLLSVMNIYTSYTPYASCSLYHQHNGWCDLYVSRSSFFPSYKHREQVSLNIGDRSGQVSRHNAEYKFRRSSALYKKGISFHIPYNDTRINLSLRLETVEKSFKCKENRGSYHNFPFYSFSYCRAGMKISIKTLLLDFDHTALHGGIFYYTPELFIDSKSPIYFALSLFYSKEKDHYAWRSMS